MFHQIRLLFFLLISSMFIATSPCKEEKRPRTALSEAIKSGDLATVRSLIETSAIFIDDLSEEDLRSPLLEAAAHAQISIIKYLIEKGAYIEGFSKNKETPLNEFIKSGSSKLSSNKLLEITRLFLDAGADINSSNIDGYTPLMNACNNSKCLALVEMLLDSGALIDAQASNGNSPLLIAIRSKNIKLFRLLLSRGANLYTTCKGHTLLGTSAHEGNLVMVKLLIEEAKIDPNDPNRYGVTPVMLAAINGHSSIIKILVENGADINARTNDFLDVEIKKSNNRLLLLKFENTYVTFPKGSTALNFAKTLSTGVERMIISLGGVLFQDVEYKEQKQNWWNGLY